MNTREIKKFNIVKAFVQYKIRRSIAYLRSDELYSLTKNLDNTGQVLGELLGKHIKDHNSKLSAKYKRIDKLKYEGSKTYKSSLIKGNGVPFKKIDELLTENPDKDWEDIYCDLI